MIPSTPFYAITGGTRLPLPLQSINLHRICLCLHLVSLTLFLSHHQTRRRRRPWPRSFVGLPVYNPGPGNRSSRSWGRNLLWSRSFRLSKTIWRLEKTTTLINHSIKTYSLYDTTLCIRLPRIETWFSNDENNMATNHGNNNSNLQTTIITLTLTNQDIHIQNATA